MTESTLNSTRNSNLNSTLYFAYPGDLDTATGGYRYDRRLIAELRALGWQVETLSLPHCLLDPSAENLQTVATALAVLPEQALVVIDGLLYGVLDEIAAAQAKRLRLVALCHHPLALEAGLSVDAQQKLQASEQRALACARATIVTSPNTRQTLIDNYAVPAEAITVALPGTEPVNFAACDGDPMQLLTIATLTRRKGHDVLIAALATLQDLPWQARFVGGDQFDMDWAAQLRQQVIDSGLAERITFAGAVESTLEEYAHADVFVLPSRYEGYGMVFAEALAAGLPIIAARAGAVPDVVPDTAGLLVPADDVSALAQALRNFMTDTKLRQRLQQGARDAAATLPGWQDTAASVARTLQQVARA